MNLDDFLHTREIVSRIYNAIHNIEEVVGKKWLDKRLKKLDEKNATNAKIKNRKLTYLYDKKPHPLVSDIHFAKIWVQHVKDHPLNPPGLNESIVNLLYKTELIDQIKHLKGFKKFSTRLKEDSEYDSAFFEIEVASHYDRDHFHVEFIEEGHTKSPDLKVTKKGIDIYVECKSRRRLSERDENIQSAWKELEARLVRVLSAKKINVAIVIKSLDDPLRDDIEPLHKFIIDSIQNGGIGHIDLKSGDVKFEFDPTEKYCIAITSLTEPDEKIYENEFGFTPPEKDYSVLIHAEMDNSEKVNYINPFCFAYKNVKQSDKVSGIIHGFSSAVKQLPKSGPGHIWIRIPDNAWQDELDKSFEEAEQIIKKELTGKHNRRVNSVVITTLNLEKKFLPPNRMNFALRPERRVINHNTPLKII